MCGSFCSSGHLTWAQPHGGPSADAIVGVHFLDYASYTTINGQRVIVTRPYMGPSEAARESVAMHLGAVYMQETLSNSAASNRYIPQKCIEYRAQEKVYMVKVNLHLPACAAYVNSVPSDKTLVRQRIPLVASARLAVASFAFDVWCAFLSRSYAEYEPISKVEMARMHFVQGEGARKGFRVEPPPPVDLHVPGPGHISHEAQQLANCPTARILVWPIYYACLDALSEQRALIPPVGSAATDSLRAKYVELGKLATAKFREFRLKAALFIRARHQIQCAVWKIPLPLRFAHSVHKRAAPVPPPWVGAPGGAPPWGIPLTEFEEGTEGQ